jgi:hypothetical protein
MPSQRRPSERAREARAERRPRRKKVISFQ